ncbi:MAG: regulatory iron-sulfur-containing complex subunit RicT, partial [Planctomycetota bacterium]
PNSGCSKSVTRKQMLDYIENSGGRDYPFFTDGRVLRVATPEDLDEQARLEQSAHALARHAKDVARRVAPDIKIVDAEPILGGERVTYYYTTEQQRHDLRALQRELSARHRERVDLRMVGARDEARITADYERCGQHCCCKNFLKVLKPVSMRSAKIQKATLDPLKISGRCGRLMCCLRYEDETYDELRKRLPKKKTRVGTPHGDGLVLDTQILTQLALVLIDDSDERVAVPVEELTEPGLRPEPKKPDPAEERPRRKKRPETTDDAIATDDGLEAAPTKKKRKRRRKRKTDEAASGVAAESDAPPIDADVTPAETGDETAAPKKKRRRRRRRKPGDTPAGAETGSAPDTESPGESPTHARGPESSGDGDAAPKKKRRRRRRKRSSGDGPGDGPGDGSRESAGPGADTPPD